MIFKRSIIIIWYFFCSLKLAIILLLFIALACIIGMFWDQTLTINEHLSSNWNNIFANLFIFFEIYDVFHSWWFSFAVFMLLLNLIVCSIERLPNILCIIYKSDKQLDDKTLKTVNFSYVLHNKNKYILKQLASKIFKSSDILRNNSKDLYWFKQKYKYAKLGVYLVHAALLVIMLGAILDNYFGLKGSMILSEGKRESKLNIQKISSFKSDYIFDFEVKCSNFRINTFIDGSPVFYKSDLEIYNPKGSKTPMLVKTIKVNSPLYYNGYIFYQSSYIAVPGHQTIKLSIGLHGRKKYIYSLNIGDELKMNDGSVVLIDKLISNFANLGSALKLKKINQNGNVSSFLIFREYANFDKLVRKGNFDFVFHGAFPRYATILTVSKTPFINVIFFGAIFLLIGLFSTFTMNNKKYYAKISYLKSKKLYELTLAFSSNVNKVSLISEYNKLKSYIK